MTQKEEAYRGFAISWVEPPMTGAEWTANVGSNDPDLQALIGKSAKVISGKSRDDMIAKAKTFVDELLD